jgi:hypothetical protein
MAAAIIYPEPEKGGRGKRSGALSKLPGSGGFSQRLSQTRVVLRHTPDNAALVLSGANSN